MPDEHAFGDAIHDAERAAAAGDFAAAETSLRWALEIQGRQRGAAHPDLASTLNNLAVVCETNGRLDDAEQFYRRACAVASAALPPSDPLVETSRANLADFCRAHGRPIDDWPELGHAAPLDARPAAPREPAVVTTAPTPPSTAAVPPGADARRRPPSTATDSWTTSGRTAGSTPRGFVGALATLAVVGTLALAWFVFASRDASTPEAGATAAVVPLDAPAPSGATASGTATPADRAPAALERPKSSPEAAAPATVAAAPSTVSTATPEPPRAPRADRITKTAEPVPPSSDAAARLVESDVCTRLTRQGRRWTCTPAGAAVTPGSVAFYTRVALTRAARIEHRWYRDGQLARTIALSVGAGGAEGYRTFSQQTVAPGQWRVEARTTDGRVLGASSFVVRD